MPYWMKYALVVFGLLLAIRLINQFVEYIKKKGVDEHENRKAIGRYLANSQEMQRAKHYELLIRARKFFLIPGVIRKRSSPGTDEDD